MKELTKLRTENSKTFDIGNGQRRIEAHIGAIHYRDNYADPTEAWKDIDLTPDANGNIAKAPYELTRDGKKLIFKDKKTSGISTIELISTSLSGLEYKIIPTVSGISFQHILSSDKVPFEAKFKVTGKGFKTRAFDDSGEIDLTTSFKDGVLTEKLSEVKDNLTKEVRLASGTIKVDPTWQVGSSTDDCLVVWRTSVWEMQALTDVYFQAGKYIADYNNFGSGARFTNVTIPQGSTINQAYLTVRAKGNTSATTVNTVIIGEDVDDAATFSTLANYQARRGTIVGGANDDNITTASVNWNSIATWTDNTEYNSPEIKTIIQEIINRVGWVSGNDLVLFWDDHAGNSSAGIVYRAAHSYNSNASYAPILIITYDTAVTPTTLALVLTTYAPSIFLGTYKIEVDWDNDGDFEDTYDDITSNVKSIHFSRGKSDELGKAEVGQCSITVNNADGKYTPGYGGVISALLKPKRPLSIRATYNGTIYNLFYGFIEEIVPHPHLTEQDCIITAVDGLDFLSRHDMATALYKDTLTGTIHEYILDDAGWSATMRTLDTGQDTVPYWYGQDVKSRFAQEEIDDSEQGFSYVDGSGYFNFEDRHHRSTAEHQTSQFTFDNTMSYVTYSLNPRNVYNIVKVTVTPWELQLIQELWRLEDEPVIPAGETSTYWGDASYSGTSVFVDAWTTPEITTDYQAWTGSGGTGTNKTADISIVTTKFAKTIKLAVTNGATVPVYLYLLKARGTYYDDQTKVTLKAEDSTSQTAYQKRTFELDGKYMTDSDKARDYVTYAIGKYKDPRAELSMSAMNQDSTILAQILGLEISDRITVINTELGLNDDYFIDYMEHDISISGLLHTVSYRLSDSLAEDFWCLDYSALASSTSDGQTKLGY